MFVFRRAALTPSLYLEQAPGGGRREEGNLWEHRSKAGKGGTGQYPQSPLAGLDRQQWRICNHQQDFQLIMTDSLMSQWKLSLSACVDLMW